MRDLVRMAYVSRATFDVDLQASEIEPDIEAILAAARTNNKNQKISGALYFGDGYFFQCLEGKAEKIDRLMKKIEQDSRHKGLKISYYKRVKRRMFNDWSMKYVPISDEVMELISTLGYQKFDPVAFDESDVNAVIDLFYRSDDPSLKIKKLRSSYYLKDSWWKRLLSKNRAFSFI